VDHHRGAGDDEQADGGLGRVLSIAKVGLPNWFRRREQIGRVPLESGLCRVV
jgi:hypothetical protein